MLNNIYFQLTVPTRGWFGLGFTETGTMKGADIIIMGVDNDFSYSLVSVTGITLVFVKYI